MTTSLAGRAAFADIFIGAVRDAPSLTAAADAALIRLEQAGWEVVRRGDTRHILAIAEDPHRWTTIKHPLACRGSGLFSCAIAQAAQHVTRWPAAGRYYVALDGRGVLQFGDTAPADDHE